MPEISRAAQKIQFALNPELTLNVMAAETALNSSNSKQTFIKTLRKIKKEKKHHSSLISHYKSSLKTKEKKHLKTSSLTLLNQTLEKLENLFFDYSDDSQSLSTHGASFVKQYVQSLSKLGLYQRNAMNANGHPLKFEANVVLESDSSEEDAVFSIIQILTAVMTSDISFRSAGLLFGPETLKKANIKISHNSDAIYFVLKNKLHSASVEDNRFVLNTKETLVKKLKNSEVRRLKAVILASARKALHGYHSRSTRFAELKSSFSITPERILESLDEG